MATFYTYLYTDPIRNEPIYVGKGKETRAYRHLRRHDKHPLTQRIGWIRAHGSEPTVTFLCTDVDEELALLCEVMAIEKYGRKDLGTGPLLNLTDGGEGSRNRKQPRTEQHELNRVAALRSPEARKKMATSCKNRFTTPEQKAAHSARMTAWWAARKEQANG